MLEVLIGIVEYHVGTIRNGCQSPLQRPINLVKPPAQTRSIGLTPPAYRAWEDGKRRAWRGSSLSAWRRRGSTFPTLC
jgi:hypothetical protein